MFSWSGLRKIFKPEATREQEKALQQTLAADLQHAENLGRNIPPDPMAGRKPPPAHLYDPHIWGGGE